MNRRFEGLVSCPPRLSSPDARLRRSQPSRIEARLTPTCPACLSPFLLLQHRRLPLCRVPTTARRRRGVATRPYRHLSSPAAPPSTYRPSIGDFSKILRPDEPVPRPLSCTLIVGFRATSTFRVPFPLPTATLFRRLLRQLVVPSSKIF